jgi:hypothetical protein
MPSFRRCFTVLSLLATTVVLIPTTAVASDPAVVTEEPIAYSTYNPCTAEPVFVTGFVHSEDRISIGTDGSLHHHLVVQIHDMTAVAPTGIRYVVQESTVDHSNGDSDFAPFNASFLFRQHLVRLGETGTPVIPTDPGDDFILWFQSHFTVNANGQVTADKFESREDCQ